MRIAITGASGQLGSVLQVALAPQHEIIALGHRDIELSSPACIEQLASTRAELVIHPAAMTNVDGCARDPDQAYRINGLGTRYVALACRKLAAPLVYVSTNEVFDGSGTRPYYEYDQTNPINAYAWSKWVGEQAVRELLEEHYIARVAWLYGGERNFIRTILRLVKERPSLRVVSDELGSPTYAPDVAQAIAQLIKTCCYGTYHLVNQGSCSRYELAAEALRLAGYADFPLEAIKLADYKRDSRVPPYTPLHNIAAADLGIRLRDWQVALSDMMKNEE